MISLLLKAHGFRVGLQVSPHLVDLRERFQLDNALISKKSFMKYLNEIIPSVELAKKTEWGVLTYFEICVCLAFYIFWKEKVDYAAMETGLGGLYDGTNVVENPTKLVLLTKIGFDHQKVLGHTLSAIASQKAGIIQTGNTVITVQQKPAVERVFYSQCESKKTSLNVIKKGEHFEDIKISKRGTTFNYSDKEFTLPDIHLGLIGGYQAENCSLALAALHALSRRDSFKIDENLIREALAKAVFRGRCEIRQTKYRDIIIDGAHNPQKMQAFISTLTALYPGQTFDFLIAFSEGKNQLSTMKKMLKQIVPLAGKIILTEFRLEGNDVFHQSVDRKRIIKVLKQLQFNRYLYLPSNKKTLQKIIREDKIPLVITGSLYFIGSIYMELEKNL